MLNLKDEGTTKVNRYNRKVESDDSNLPPLITVLIVAAIALLIFL